MKSAMNRKIHTPACYTLKMKWCNTKTLNQTVTNLKISQHTTHTNATALENIFVKKYFKV